MEKPAVRAALAVARAAERAGAPIFAAQALSSVSKQVPARQLPEHLLRTAELFVAGGDVTRAGVVLAFARARAGRSGLRGERWAAVKRAVEAGSDTDRARPSTGSGRAEAFPDVAATLAAAARATQAARSLAAPEGDHP